VKLDVGFDLTIYARCRIYGINAPELSTQAGKDARDYAQTLLPVDAQVGVSSHGWDKYGGRIDASLVIGGQDFGTRMLEDGHAVPYPVS
jgi:endonuclease YncB( thermonuclease family)